MKKIYEFKINKKIIIEEAVVKKDAAGQEIKVLEKVEKITPVNYIIRKPNRADYDDAELFYAIRFSQDVRNGILTRSEIIKRFTNDDVTIKKTYDDFAVKQSELERLTILEKNPELNEKRDKLEKELLALLVDMQNFEANKSSILENTAENRARNKTVFWWILNLAYKVEDGKEIPLFDGDTFEDKVKSYDKLSEIEDEHHQEAIQRFFYLIPGWYSNQFKTEKDFAKAEALLTAEMQKLKDEQKEGDETPPNKTEKPPIKPEAPPAKTGA